MGNKVSAEQRQHIKDRNWGKYILIIWNGAVLFFLVDLLFGSLITVIVYIVMKAVLWLVQPWTTIPVGYADKAIALFCLIYLVSLAIVAWWRHFSLIVYRAKHIDNGGSSNQGQQLENKASVAE